MDGRTPIDYRIRSVFMAIMTSESTGITYSAWDDKFHYGALEFGWEYGADNQFTRDYQGWVCLTVKPAPEDTFIRGWAPLPYTVLACRWKIVGAGVIQYDLLWDLAAVLRGEKPRRNTWTTDGPNPMLSGTIPKAVQKEVHV